MSEHLKVPFYSSCAYRLISGWTGSGSAIRSGQYKLILRYDDESVELYDLDNDLGETKNLANEKPKVAQQLKERLTG